MDRSRSSELVDSPSMHVVGPCPVELLPRAVWRRERRKLAADEADRRAVFEAALLWVAPDDRLVGRVGLEGQRETCGAADAGDGPPSHPARTPYQSASSCTSGLSVFVARTQYSDGERGLVCRHYLLCR